MFFCGNIFISVRREKGGERKTKRGALDPPRGRNLLTIHQNNQ
jgi:hypothetical protein